MQSHVEQVAGSSFVRPTAPRNTRDNISKSLPLVLKYCYYL